MSMPYDKITDPGNFSTDVSSHSGSHHHGDTDEMNGSHGELGNRKQLRGQPHSFLGNNILLSQTNLYQSFPRTLPSTVPSHCTLLFQIFRPPYNCHSEAQVPIM